MSGTVALVRWPVQWAALEDMQDFASRYCKRRFPGDVGDRARVVSHELLENAVRFATVGSDLEFEIRDLLTGFEVRVSNDAVDSRMAILRKRIAETRDGDADEAYRRALRKLLVDASDPKLVNIGIGLLRARYEANVDFSVAATGRRVTVTATGTSARAGRQ